MSRTVFEQNIINLNFSFLNEGNEGGIFLTHNYEAIAADLATPDILFALEIAKNKFDADAVYFRYFEDGRSLVPQLYLFDYTNKPLTDQDRNRLHIQMWNGYQVPVYMIITNTTVSIFDAREKPNEGRNTYAKEIITLTGEAISKFKAQSFDDGLFWEEQDEKKHFKFEQSAARDLIRGLKEVYKSFQEHSGLNRHVALKLLVQSLLIKYLEERDEDSASGYFAGTYFKTHFNCVNFCDVIRNGKLLNLLDQLAKDFNGKIFEWDRETEIEERKAIATTSVQQLADYLDGTIKDNQFVFWRLYSFSHLPVEVLSSVYEELLTDSKDIVYTPEMIVSTLVDECMPLKHPQHDFKIIDVSCGSGIFLVKTYKRIVQWWRYEQWQMTGELKKPSMSVLKDLLLKSIYGVDIQQDAIRLSIFSLALAILDEVNLDPPTWGKLRFPDLSNNIIVQDFFQYISDKPLNSFNLVVGNPPFNLQAVNNKEPDRKRYFKSLYENVGYRSEIDIPDENPALHFLVKSMSLLKSEAMLCMIQPSGPLLYQNDGGFKKQLFSRYNLLQVVDFTKLADKLWGRKTVATAAVFIQNSKPDNENVVHIIANRTFSNNNRIFLEFDHYDFHTISKDSLQNNAFAWKANLLGGGRVLQLIERLAKLPTLGSYLKKKKKENNWTFGDGFIKGKPDAELTPENFEKKKGGYTSAPFLTNAIYFNPEDFDESGIGKFGIIRDEFFQWPRVAELFNGPILLIKKNIGRKSIPALLTEQSIAFKNEVIGIHAPLEDIDELKYIEDTFKHNHIYRFYLTLTSSRAGISRSSSTLLQKDIMALPFSDNEKLIRLSKAEEILVDTIINYHLGFAEKKLYRDCSNDEILSFASIFCQTLNSIYDDNGKSFQLYKILDAGHYYALHFEYGDQILKYETEVAEDLEQYLRELMPTHNENYQYHTQRISKVYGNNSIVLAKPKQLRYWLPSIALRDADETFDDYIKARYHYA